MTKTTLLAREVPTLLRKIEAQKNGVSVSKIVDAAGKENTNIDWKLAFDYLDHRRLGTFGVVGDSSGRFTGFLWRTQSKSTMTRRSRTPIGVRNPSPPMMAIVSITRMILEIFRRSAISRR